MIHLDDRLAEKPGCRGMKLRMKRGDGSGWVWFTGLIVN